MRRTSSHKIAVAVLAVLTGTATIALAAPTPATARPEPAPPPGAASPTPQPAMPGDADAPDPLADGTPRMPTHAPRLPRPANPPTATAPTATPLVFRTSGYQPIDVPDAYRPWRSRVVARVDTGVHDAGGVRMFRWEGRTWNHPVGQAQYGLQNLNTYRRTGDVFFLARARAQADRLVDTRVEARGAWYFPYAFDFELQNHAGVILRAPWYSGMAQGEAMGLFAQLAQVPALDEATRANYRTAADGAFASLALGPEARPWVVQVDGAGYLWLQEYPVEPPARSDFAYNGHMFATLGLWDYARLTGSELAARLFDGAATTVAVYGPAIRGPGWYSRYCIAHHRPHPIYHVVHIRLLLQLQWLTGQPRFAALSDRFTDDYPPPDVSGEVAFSAATHTFYRFNTAGTVTATKRLTFPRPSSAHTDTRVRILGRGIHYRLIDGAAAGWYAPEAHARAFLRGLFVGATYLPPRVAGFAAGRRYSGYRFDATGNQIGARTASFARASSAPSDRRATINGRVYHRITTGGFADHWIAASVLSLNG